jgi:hypothetical protein
MGRLWQITQCLWETGEHGKAESQGDEMAGHRTSGWDSARIVSEPSRNDKSKRKGREK